MQSSLCFLWLLLLILPWLLIAPDRCYAILRVSYFHPLYLSPSNDSSGTCSRPANLTGCLSYKLFPSRASYVIDDVVSTVSLHCVTLKPGNLWELHVGNADGLGSIRKKEILASARILGLRSDTDIAVLDDPSFPDSMSTTWSSEKIVSLLDSFFLKSNYEKSSRRKEATTDQSSSAPPKTTIDILLTFDGQGVSSHPNHVSLYHGALAWARSLTSNSAGWENPVAVYTLTSVSILRKYMGILDAPLTMAWAVGSNLQRRAKSQLRVGPDKMLFVSDIGEYLKAREAMVNAHKSQMVWFRWGWITLGRYMVVNDLRRARV